MTNTIKKHNPTNPPYTMTIFHTTRTVYRSNEEDPLHLIKVDENVSTYHIGEKVINIFDHIHGCYRRPRTFIKTIDYDYDDPYIQVMELPTTEEESQQFHSIESIIHVYYAINAL